MCPIVGVHPGKEGGGGLPRRPSERGGDALGRGVDRTQPGLARSRRGEDLRRAVGRAVVNRDHLEVGKALCPQAVQGLREARLRVPARQENADSGHGF